MQFLLEKLVNREAPGMGKAPPFDLAAAIAEQIQRLVMCRPSVAAGDIRIDDFGMPSIVEFGIGSSDRERYGRWLLRAIAHYEPRLLEPRLEWVDGDHGTLTATLKVHGRLPGESTARVFRFDAPRAERR
ncbi:hypothetical protein [Oleiagrimonas soli]|uniref:Putative component of type VI protein secretion system n=1 Tax=Oleiagrimonas soli TaxID=1543381 RepID=A0A841KHL0_9GAMM|nr:hypothetical protein [Oleiagrimonas soli]MBB6183239.1 putative component of type VI protein secretion system [Oleiagrimonas soli]